MLCIENFFILALAIQLQMSQKKEQHTLMYFQLVKAGLVLGLFGGTQKFANDKVRTLCLLRE